jgi:hypothetical protein
VSLNDTLGKADVGGARKSVGELLATCAAPAARRAGDRCGRPRSVVGHAQDPRTDDETMRASSLIDSNGDTLAITLDNLRVTSENLREASETARAYPSSLLFGSPPATVEAPAK